MNKPILAITIPCYNEELCIEKTVYSLFEVLDDLIQKNTLSIASCYRQRIFYFSYKPEYFFMAFK